MELFRLLKRQVVFASLQLGLIVGAIIGAIFMLAVEIPWFGIIIMSGCYIAFFVFWILGMINAVKVNKITGDSTILIVFSVITLFFGHLIVAFSQKNKFNSLATSQLRSEIEQEDNVGPMAKQSVQHNYDRSAKTSKELKLRQAFLDGIISSTEYEKKLKELNNDN